MKLYIDKENLKSIIDGQFENPLLYNEFIKYVKRGLDVQYNFSKEEFNEDESLESWFRSVKGQGVKTKSFYCPEEIIFPKHPVDLETFSFLCKQKDGLRSIYMIKASDNIADFIKNKNAVLFCNVGEEYEIINSLEMVEEKQDSVTSDEIKSWEQYCPPMPLTDLIIIDDYYFSNKYIYEKNKNEIITSMSKFAKEEINIVIITREVDDDIDLELECDNIKNSVCSCCTLENDKCHVTIIKSRKFHDRHLLSNYYRINPGCGFHLKDPSKKDDVLTRVAPHTSIVEFNTTNKLIKMCNRTIINNIGCYGDKKSNLIDFEQEKK